MSWGAIGGAAISTVGSALSGGGSGGGMPRWLKKKNKSAVARAEALSNRPYTPFTGQRVAGLGQNERAAGALARNYSAGLQPYLRGLTSSTQFDPSQLSQYEDPYLDRVLESRRRVIGEEFGRQSADLGRRQSAMDAFGTGRSMLARSRLDEARMRALDDAEAEARSGAFNAAMGFYGDDRRLGAQANLGALQSTINAQNAQMGALAQTGATERSIRQAGMDFDYGQFLEGRDWDVNNFGVLLDALRTAQGAQGNSAPSDGELLTGLLGTAMSNGAFDGLFDRWTGSAPVNSAGDAAAGLGRI